MITERIEQLGGIKSLSEETPVPLTVSEIEQFEGILNSLLPDDYKYFLSNYGKSSFVKEVKFHPYTNDAEYIHSAEIGLPNFKFYGSQVSYFYGLNTDNNNFNIINKFNIYANRLPKDFLPIADDGLGNQICLSLSKEKFNWIYWWDHENEWDEEDYLDDTGHEMSEEVKFQNVYLIAKSFTEFIEKLQIVE